MAKATSKVTISFEVDLAELAGILHETFADGNTPSVKKMLETPGFKEQLTKFVQEDVNEYALGMFQQSYDENAEGQGDLMDFLNETWGSVD